MKENFEINLMESASDKDSGNNGRIKFYEIHGDHFALDSNGKLSVFDLIEQMPIINFTVLVTKLILTEK